MTETFVLISGAWHSGWTWRLVAQRLRAAGHHVLAPDLPGLADGDDPERYSLADASDFIVDLVGRHDLRDITLVGHSWGGVPLTGAAHRLAPRLRKLIYWSAFVPAEGTPMLEEAPPHYGELFRGLAAASGNNSVALPYDVFSSAFMQDADESTQRTVHSFLVPQPMRYFTETVKPIDPAALGIPAVYLLSSDDISLPPGEFSFTPRFPHRLGPATPVIEIPGSHEAQFTRPAELAAALLKA
ncbi:alpha/beta fold hydrolase [Streptomyces sp. NPDC050619]|uniref:alpha/beta hydrolase n=1 Tax=Streptomyces sp. NPDC050619 TaxID=3157214 RepID=UPI00342864E7